MAVLDLARCPICHTRDSLARQTTELESRTHVTYECHACGTLLAWLGDEMWLEADRWSFQKVGRPERADLLYRSMTVAELRKLAGEKPVPLPVINEPSPPKPLPVWIEIAAAEVEPPLVQEPVAVEELPTIETVPAATAEPLPVEGEVAAGSEDELPAVTHRRRKESPRRKESRRDRAAAQPAVAPSPQREARSRSRGSPFLVLSVAVVLLCLICGVAIMIIYAFIDAWTSWIPFSAEPPAVDAIPADTAGLTAMAGHIGSMDGSGWYRVTRGVRNPHGFAVGFPGIVATCCNGAHADARHRPLSRGRPFAGVTGVGGV